MDEILTIPLATKFNHQVALDIPCALDTNQKSAFIFEPLVLDTSLSAVSEPSRAVDTNSLFFDNWHVSMEDSVGEENEGF